LIFDVDGTLVDTNPSHVEAWVRAFATVGYRVDADRIQPLIGMGGDKLVPSLLGPTAEARVGDEARALQPKEFRQIAESRGFSLFPGALDLLAEIRRRRLKVVLATSSDARQFAGVEAGAKVKFTDHVDEVVTAADAGGSKPDPDLIHASLDKLHLGPAQCAMVGDTNFDMTAAKRAGVVGVGVLTGFQDEQTLRLAGARGVYKNPADMLAHLDEALRLLAPAPARITNDLLDDLMRRALDVARLGLTAKEAPIGCVLADGDGKVVAEGHNQLNATQDRTAHAEMVTFARAAGKILPPDRKDLILVSTLEPCVMCLGAAMEAGVDTIAFGLRAPADSGTGRVAPPQSPESQMPRIIGEIRATESRALFEEFLRVAENPQQVAFVRQLLALTNDR
ncbi:MAG: HAD-IA family hydrolase, partial [Phycisphaerae bacterium]